MILEREATGIGFEKFPITVEGRTVGWVEGDRTGGRSRRSCPTPSPARRDKRSLAREALDRYRELNLVYELADRLSGELDLDEIGRVVVGRGVAAAGRRRRVLPASSRDDRRGSLGGGRRGRAGR